MAVMANWYGKGKRGAVMGELSCLTCILNSQILVAEVLASFD